MRVGVHDSRAPPAGVRSAASSRVFRPAIEAWAASRTKLEACRELAAGGVAAGPSNGAADLRADPHVALRNLLIEVPRPDVDEPLLDHGNPVKLSPVAEGPVSRFPRPGQHTDELLREAGISDDEIRELRNRGVV